VLQFRPPQFEQSVFRQNGLVRPGDLLIEQAYTIVAFS
jgi:hypothetical protein